MSFCAAHARLVLFEHNVHFVGKVRGHSRWVSSWRRDSVNPFTPNFVKL